MAERLRALLARFLEWWGKFSAKQKAVIISAVAVVVVAVGIAAFVFTRPTIVTLTTATSAVESQSIADMLAGENITYYRSDDGLTYSVNKNDLSNARILLGAANIPTAGFGINDVISGSFTTTEADTQKLYTVYLEDQLRRDIERMDSVKTAKINLNIPKDDGTLIASKEDKSASVSLELYTGMDSDTAGGLARYIATALGNKDTSKIVIMDTQGNMLFSGGDEATSAGIASSNQKVKIEAERLAANKVKNILQGSTAGSIYDNVEIGINLDMTFSSEESVDYHYYLNEGQTQGYLDSRHVSKTESQNGIAGVPGTDSNDDTTYVMQDYEVSKSSSSDVDEDFLPSEKITTVKGEVGVVSYESSTITVVAYNYVVYNEDELKANGTLDEMTMEEFAAQNRDNVPREVGEDIYQAVSNATRIPVANISILAYDVPMINYSENLRDWTDYLQIVLAVLIILMLGFVVLRTLRKEEEEEVEAEVSVEELMEEDEIDLEAVKFSEKSEARIMIEQFVDERPEAVASLLRNWLNEEWGE